jgi:hypothetical protein
VYLIPHSGLTKSGNEKHWTSFFQNTERTYLCIIMHILKKAKTKAKHNKTQWTKDKFDLICNVHILSTSEVLPIMALIAPSPLHRNRRYFVIKLNTWFCLSYFLKTNIKLYCIYQYFMSINSFLLYLWTI